MGVQQEDTVPLDRQAVDDALEELEDAMKWGEMSLSHEKVRMSTDRMAHSARDAYRALVRAHPDYDLKSEVDC